MSSNIARGPIAYLNNPPIEPQFYAPNVFLIESISQGLTPIVLCGLR